MEGTGCALDSGGCLSPIPLIFYQAEPGFYAGVMPLE